MGRMGSAIKGAISGGSSGNPYLAAAGGLAGFLFGGDDEEMPDVKFSDESMRRLEEEFPEYAAAIQANKLAYGDLSRAVDRQQQGPSQREQAQQQEYMGQVAAGQSMQGNAGQPMAQAMMADAQARTSGAMYDQANQRAMSALAMQQQAGQGLASQYGAMGQLQNSARASNIQNSLAMDYARQGRDIAGYEGNRQDNQNFIGDLMGAGQAAYGISQNPQTRANWIGSGQRDSMNAHARSPMSYDDYYMNEGYRK